MIKKISRYWWCQTVGWSINIAISIFFISTFGQPNRLYFFSLFLTCLLGILITHVMRFNIHFLKVMDKQMKLQIIYFFILTLLFSVLFGLTSEAIDHMIGYNPERLQKFSRPERLFLSSFNAMWILLFWNMIYFMYHFVEKNRKQKLDTFRLEALVKTLELQTIKSHINPHFIFNALNSIRALVDENPERARKAITELSNILRSSLQAEKMETVPLCQELNIVQDYLALEHMRFEERLQIKMDINEDTLNQPVPPMMLQIMVENAIKHGISLRINGGLIRIISTFTDTHHELTVQNSGKLDARGRMNEEGFGIKSTKDRLKLLYKENAHFEIREIEGGIVESRILMPVNFN